MAACTAILIDQIHEGVIRIFQMLRVLGKVGFPSVEHHVEVQELDAVVVISTL